jgi:prephenate dehydrogenase
MAGGAVEHLPRLLSVALMPPCPANPPGAESRKLAGGTFQQLSAGATGDPDSLRDDFLGNRAALRHWLDLYTAELGRLRDRLAIDPADTESAEQLAQAIDQAVVERHNWRLDFEQKQLAEATGAPPPVEIPGFWERWLGFGAMRRKRDPGDRR